MENETMMVNMVRAKMLIMIDKLELDEDGNGTLSKAEFEQLLVLPEAAQFMQSVGVDVVGLVEFSDFIFKDGREMDFVDFVELVLQLRGSNQATVKDIVDMRKQMTAEFDRFSFEFSPLSGAINRVLDYERNENFELSDMTKNVDQLQKALLYIYNGTPNAPRSLGDANKPVPEPPAVNPPALYDDAEWVREMYRKRNSEEVPAVRRLSAGHKDDNSSASDSDGVPTRRVEQVPFISADQDLPRPQRPLSSKRSGVMTVDQKAQWEQMMQKFAEDSTTLHPQEQELLDVSDLRNAFGGFRRFDYEEEV
jgi:hypothetical protein